MGADLVQTCSIVPLLNYIFIIQNAAITVCSGRLESALLLSPQIIIGKARLWKISLIPLSGSDAKFPALEEHLQTPAKKFFHVKSNFTGVLIIAVSTSEKTYSSSVDGMCIQVESLNSRVHVLTARKTIYLKNKIGFFHKSNADFYRLQRRNIPDLVGWSKAIM